MSSLRRARARSLARVESARRRRARGFTLIELIVAMAIVSLALIIVAPALLAGLNRASLYAAKGEFESQLKDLRWEAFKRQTRLVVVERLPNAVGEADRADDLTSIVLSSGFAFRLNSPIVIEPNGRCSGGLVRIGKPGGIGMDLRLSAPLCRSAAL